MSSDDYFAIDGTTSSTRKMSAATPVFTTVQTTGTGTTATFAGSCSIATNLTVASSITQSTTGITANFTQTNSFGSGKIATSGLSMVVGGGTSIATIIQSGGGNAVTFSASNQSATFAGTIIHTLSATPASATATGTVGTISWDSGYIYICTATDTWKRVAIATWP
tara:strand:+ start:518 stop:1015 length:498 start_codon:yes stop_codon:yes gene_type:complete